jgi:hypothetical protein
MYLHLLFLYACILIQFSISIPLLKATATKVGTKTTGLDDTNTNTKGSKATKRTKNVTFRSHGMYYSLLYAFILYVLFLPHIFTHTSNNGPTIPTANLSMSLNIDPASMTIEELEQFLIGLEGRRITSGSSALDDQVQVWAKWAVMNKNLYGDSKNTAAIRELFGNTTRYEKQKGGSVARFFSILASHPELMVRHLADLIPHPETGEQVPRFVVFCTGRKTDSKKKIVNAAMTIFAVNMIMINKNDESAMDLAQLSPKELADLQYSPSTFALYYKHIFSWMKQESIPFQQSDFKGMKGKLLFYVFHICWHYFHTLF